MKTDVVGTHYKRLGKALLMSTTMYVFMEQLEKYFPDTHSYLDLWIICKFPEVNKTVTVSEA